MDTAATSPGRLEVEPGEHTLILVRHGRTAENAGGRILGRRDPPLDDVGVAQAHALAEMVRCAPLAAVWASPLRRALRTAEIAGAALGIAPTVLDDLMESDRG